MEAGGASLFGDVGSGAGSDALDAAESDALLAAFVDDLLLPAGALSNDVDSAPLAAQLDEVELPFDGDRAWRCLDCLHVRRCALCQPPPAEGEEDAVELRGVDGKKNGEKRLRSLISRTPEWLNAGARDAAARACDDEAAAAGGAAAASHARLAAALRARHCVMMRKGELLRLCRMWRYRCDVWRRRRNDAAEPAEPPRAALPPWQPPPAGPQWQVALPGAGASAVASLGADAASALQLLPAAAAAAVAGGGGDLRALAARSGTSSSALDRTRWLLNAVEAAPPAARPYYVQVLRRKMQFLQYAQAKAHQLGARATEAHAALQAPLLQLAPEERSRATWLVLAGRGEEPLEAILRNLAGIAAEAMGDAPRVVVPASALGDEGGASTVSIHAGDPGLVDGARAALELAARCSACLAAMRLAPYVEYLHCMTALLALFIGFSAGTAAALQLHLDAALPALGAA